MTLHDRVAHYQTTFPDWPPPVVQAGRIYGIWLLGNDYRGSGYHGAYPPNYVRRVAALFPDARADAQHTMHLFSGSLPKGDYLRVDLRDDVECDLQCDAQVLSSQVPVASFDIIYADPPYTNEDADHYGNPMVSRGKVIAECWKVLRPNGYLIWLDQVLPMYAKTHWSLDGVIGVVRSTNHRARLATILRKVVVTEEQQFSNALLGLKR